MDAVKRNISIICAVFIALFLAFNITGAFLSRIRDGNAFFERLTETPLIAVFWLLVFALAFAVIKYSPPLCRFFKSDIKIIISLIALKLIFTLPVIFLSDILPRSDFGTYFQLAARMADGGEFQTAYFSAFPHIMGYPFFLSLFFRIFGESITAACVLNAVLSALSAGLIFLIVKTLAGREYGFLAALLWTFFPSQNLYSVLVCTEHIFLFFILCAVFICVKLVKKEEYMTWQRILFSVIMGIFCAMASAIRPNGLVVFVAILIYIILNFTRQKSRENGAFVYIKWILAAVFILTYFIGTNLASYSGERFLKAPVAKSGIGWNLYVGLNYESLGMWNMEDSELFGELIEAEGPQKMHEKFFELALKRMDRVRPNRETLSFFMNKSRAMWSSDADVIMYAVAGQNPESAPAIDFIKNEKLLRLICNGFYYMVFILCIYSVIRSVKMKKSGEMLLPALIVTGTILLHMPFEAALRYHHGAVAFLCMIAGMGIYTETR